MTRGVVRREHVDALIADQVAGWRVNTARKIAGRRESPAADEPRACRSSENRHARSRSHDMKLTASMMLTLDGVYQGPGGPGEDRRGGFHPAGLDLAVDRPAAARRLT